MYFLFKKDLATLGEGIDTTNIGAPDLNGTRILAICIIISLHKKDDSC